MVINQFKKKIAVGVGYPVISEYWPSSLLVNPILHIWLTATGGGKVVGSEEISKFVSASSDSRYQRSYLCFIARNGLNQRRKNTKGQTHRLPSHFNPYLLN